MRRRDGARQFSSGSFRRLDPGRIPASASGFLQFPSSRSGFSRSRLAALRRACVGGCACSAGGSFLRRPQGVGRGSSVARFACRLRQVYDPTPEPVAGERPARRFLFVPQRGLGLWQSGPGPFAPLSGAAPGGRSRAGRRAKKSRPANAPPGFQRKRFPAREIPDQGFAGRSMPTGLDLLPGIAVGFPDGYSTFAKKEA